MVKRLVLLVTFILIGIMLIISGCTGKVAQTPSTGAQVQNEPAQPASTLPANNKAGSANVEEGIVGTTYTVNYMGSKYQVTLKEAEFASSNNLYLSGSYLMAYFEIKNVGDESQTFAPDIYSLDSDGEKYDKTIALGLGDKYSKTLDFYKSLPPNTKTSGWVAVKVPDGTTSIDLYFVYTNPYLSKTPNYIKYRIGDQIRTQPTSSSEENNVGRQLQLDSQNQHMGCIYFDPKCSDFEECINNTCVSRKGCQYNEPICSEGYKCNFFTGNCDVAKDESQMTLEEILKQREEEARQATLFQEQKEIINRDLYKKHYGETTIYRNNISITLNQIKEFLTPDGKRIKFDLSFKNLKDEKQAVSNLRIIANDGIAYVFYCPVLSSGLEPTQEISVNCTLDWVPRLTMISTIVREEDFGNLYLLYNYSDVIQPLEGFE